jgi:hypothetical protein
VETFEKGSASSRGKTPRGKGAPGKTRVTKPKAPANSSSAVSTAQPTPSAPPLAAQQLLHANPPTTVAAAATTSPIAIKPSSNQHDDPAGSISESASNSPNPPASAQPESQAGHRLGPSNPQLSTRVPASQRPFEQDVVEQYKDTSLDELRRIGHQFAENFRLTAEHRLILDEIYKKYQREVHTMAITHKLDPSVCLGHLGNKTRIRGPSSYNNFCLYNPEASPIHHDCKCPTHLLGLSLGLF